MTYILLLCTPWTAEGQAGAVYSVADKRPLKGLDMVL